jgi:hypothetical protein
MKMVTKAVLTAVVLVALAIPAVAADKLIVNTGANIVNVNDTGQFSLGTATPDANAVIHVKKTKSGVVALRVENTNIFNAGDAAAQEQFVLGPAGQEHIIFQVLSDSVAGFGVPGVSGTAMMNCYTHDFFIRTNGANVFKLFKAGAVADTLVIKTGLVGIGTPAPTAKLQVVGLIIYANNAAARSAGLTTGAFYRTGGDPDLVSVVHD